MQRIVSALVVMMFIFSIVGVGFAEAKSSTRSSSPSSSFKPSSSTSKPSVSISKPKSSTTTKSTTTKPTTSTSKPKTSTTTKKSTTTSKPKTTTSTKPKTTVKVNPIWIGSPFYSNGNFSKYLVTAAGAYLIYEGLEDDGDPIYVDAYTGEEVDDDDLEDLDVKVVDSIPTKVKEVSTDDDDGFLGGFIALLVLGLFIIIFVIVLVNILRRK